MAYFDSFLIRKNNEYPEKFDSSELYEQFIPYYNSGQRVEIDFGYEKKRGYIGVTTGWKPCFILLLKSNSIGSAYTLSEKDTVCRTFPKYKN